MLDAKSRAMWDEANAMLLANILDSKKAHLLQISLRLRAAEAHDCGRSDHEAKLQQAADDLAARFLPPV